MASAAPRKSGLTLIEVMLAVVLLGIGAGVLLTATARCLAVVSLTQRYGTAQRLIRQLSAEQPITRSLTDSSTESGRFDEEGYRWEREIIAPEEDDRSGLYTVRTRVIWSERGQNRFEESVTWLCIPPEKEP
jgi:prepilin-type N-terminal cleavage/methylation domain-containing protein